VRLGFRFDRRLAGAAFLVIGTLLWWFLKAFESSVADGFDGYYYVMQLVHLERHGSFHSPDYNLFYLPLLAADLFLSPLYAYKAAVAFTGFLYSAAWYRVFRTRYGAIGSVPLSVLLLASPMTAFFALQFPKNLLGLAILLFLVSFRLEKNVLGTAICLALLFFSHRLAFALGAAFMLTDLLCRKIDRNRMARYIGIGIGAALLILAFLVFGHRFLPGIISIRDIARVAESGTDAFSYWGPVSFMSSWGLWTEPAWIADIVLTHAGLAVSAFLLVAGAKSAERALALITIALLIPLWSFSSGSLGYRLCLNGWTLAGGIACLALPSTIIGRARGLVGMDSPLHGKPARALAYACALALLSLLACLPNYDHRRFNPPVRLYEDIALKVGEALAGIDTDVIIAHQGIKEQLIILTGRDALNWEPDERSANTWRIMASIPDYALSRYLDREERAALVALPAGYYLIQENVFDRFIERVRADGQDSLLRSIETWQNPVRRRPSYL